MTRKVYKSAMGKSVDLGALLLQNEQVRAVGNMNVNAAGDLIDGTNQVIETRHRQVQRQYNKQTNVNNMAPASGTISARKKASVPEVEESAQEDDATTQDMSESDTPLEEFDRIVAAPQPVATAIPAQGGLAAAIARNREVKQELEKTLKQRSQEQGVRKI